MKVILEQGRGCGVPNGERFRIESTQEDDWIEMKKIFEDILISFSNEQGSYEIGDWHHGYRELYALLLNPVFACRKVVEKMSSFFSAFPEYFGILECSLPNIRNASTLMFINDRVFLSDRSQVTGFGFDLGEIEIGPQDPDFGPTIVEQSGKYFFADRHTDTLYGVDVLNLRDNQITFYVRCLISDDSPSFPAHEADQFFGRTFVGTIVNECGLLKDLIEVGDSSPPPTSILIRSMNEELGDIPAGQH